MAARRALRFAGALTPGKGTPLEATACGWGNSGDSACGFSPRAKKRMAKRYHAAS